MHAIEAHKSLKHVFVVDENRNLSDQEDLLWALTTRFQGGKDMYTCIYPNSPGSSLDPSSELEEDKKEKLVKRDLIAHFPHLKNRKDSEKINEDNSN